MIGKFYFLLSLLQAVVSEEWRADIPRNVTAQRGVCARIPCYYSYPSNLENELRTGVWFNNVKWAAHSIVFHSRDHVFESSKFRHRTQLTGDLDDGECTLVINYVKQTDEGPYFFRIEFQNGHNFDYPVIQLHVSDFTDKPSISATEMVAGKPENINCTFNTKCETMVPTLTWDMPTDISASSSRIITPWGDSMIYTSVLTLTPELKHHGQNLTCRVRYPFVSSEQTLTLIVKLPTTVGQKLPVIPLAVTAVILFLIVTSAVIFLICKTQQSTISAQEDALRHTSGKEFGKVTMRNKQKEKEHGQKHDEPFENQVTDAGGAQKKSETALHHHTNQYQMENI
ncbi:sialic acid-binding Ig-like lectin 7 isoform X2 [Hypanus sabinus]|uniref:sialic acid-binding Ig-like lectin 7 isoform X2 n=1 Tax=Hypanus sabinus TaxID=79690 RepID=UPI0028C39C24|nr:sialic acid-binding Ig-like lectin 7 isoform X2 [Hypanus sabinus]